ALRDYRQYLALPANRRDLSDAQLSVIRGKILLLGWLDPAQMTLPALLRDKSVCTEALETVCDRYAAWVQIHGGTAPSRGLASTKAKARGKRGARRSGENDALWALRDLVAG